MSVRNKNVRKAMENHQRRSSPRSEVRLDGDAVVVEEPVLAGLPSDDHAVAHRPDLVHLSLQGEIEEGQWH